MALTLNNDLSTLKIGDYFWCKYTAPTANTVGTFSDIATKTDAEATPVIPVTSSATPTGYFKYIVVDFDHLGRVKLIADRNIQHTISWDKINEQGMTNTGREITFAEHDPESLRFTTRLLTGGTVSTDKDNEWDKYIVGSTLGGAITAGDNGVWNASIFSSTSTVNTAGSDRRTLRGGSTLASSSQGYSVTANTSTGFRPVLLIESLFTLLNKSFILFNSAYRKFVGGSPATEASYSNAIPTMTSNTAPSGTASASGVYDVAYSAWKAFDGKDSTVDATSMWMMTGASGWLAYDFGVGTTKKVLKYKLIGQLSNLTRTPKNWTFEGSNDGTNWIVLDTQTNITDWADNVYKEFSVSNSNQFQKYRINISANNGNASYTSIGELIMLEEDTPAIPATPSYWQSISTTLPTLDTFKVEGIDDLSVFNRAETVIALPMDDNTASGTTLGAGKVFKEKIDLNKFFDLKKLDVK